MFMKFVPLFSMLSFILFHFCFHFSLMYVFCLLLILNGVFAVQYRPDYWMEDLSQAVRDLTLQQITLPGAHDAASFTCTTSLCGEPKYLNALIWVANHLDLDVSEIIQGWSISQRLNFTEQLMHGARYIDLRACYDSDKHYWRTCHGPDFGGPMLPLLVEIKQFLLSHPKEVVVVESAIQCEPKKDIALRRELLDMVTSTFGNLLYPRELNFTKTIGEMQDLNKRIIFTSPDYKVHHVPELLKDYPMIWNATAINNSYANSPELKRMEEYNTDKMVEWHLINRTSPYNLNQFYKMSWTLTPNEDTILESVLPDRPKKLLELADSANVKLKEWYSQLPVFPNQYPVLGNILIIDDFGNSPIVEVLLEPLVQRLLTMMNVH